MNPPPTLGIIIEGKLHLGSQVFLANLITQIFNDRADSFFCGGEASAFHCSVARQTQHAEDSSGFLRSCPIRHCAHHTQNVHCTVGVPLPVVRELGWVNCLWRTSLLFKLTSFSGTFQLKQLQECLFETQALRSSPRILGTPSAFPLDPSWEAPPLLAH